MPRTAVMADGTELEFPDEATDEAMQRGVKAYMAKQGGSSMPPSPEVPSGPEGSAAGRFVGGVWKNINPVSIAQGLYGAVRHPIDTIGAVGSAMGSEWEKAGTAASEGRYSEAVGHGAAGSIPLIGPAAAAAGERIGAGDVAGGLGEGTGLLLPIVGPRGAQAALRGVRGAGGALEAAATGLERGAAAKVADVMSPKVGAGKVRFGNTAERIAPALVKDLAADGAPLTRGGFHTQIQGRLAQAEQALDAAADARLPTQAFSAREILSGLEARRAALTSKAVGRGTSVVPAPNAARVAVIDQAIAEIKKMRGPMVRYDPIRVMRQAYDGQAKVVYNPSMTADFLRVKGKALGAADVTGVLRENLAKWDPQTAAANAEYSLYRSADDVLKATAEVERTRPRVGRQIMARLTGGILGAQAGPAGAVAGWVGGPLLDSAFAAGATTQLKTAALMQRLATAVRSGDLGMVNSIAHQLKRLGLSSAAVSGQTTGAPAMQPVPASQ